jgi:hypothetical protein
MAKRKIDIKFSNTDDSLHLNAREVAVYDVLIQKNGNLVTKGNKINRVVIVGKTISPAQKISLTRFLKENAVAIESLDYEESRDLVFLIADFYIP